MPILTAPVADLSHELFTYKSRVQEQEQIIISLRRDLAGMTARLSDVQGELSEKQKRALEKSELTIREQTKELNDTRLKLSKLSDIVDKQSTQIESLQSDLA
jgi:chromosome segregation ATPase